MDGVDRHTAGRFADLLRRFRLDAGLSQEELAERSGLSAHGISDLERGARRFPYPHTIARLSDALEVDPDRRAALQAAARRLTAGTLPVDRPEGIDSSEGETSAVAPLSSNLPAPLTSFIGREQELLEVQRLLGVTRLLTLTGAGGSGKTRLAMQAATELAAAYADGIWVVDLAPLGHGELVAHTVAGVLGVRERPGHAIVDTLLQYLRERVILLVLDNCEHLVAACATLVETLVHRCAGLHVLATSREVLGIAGETTWRVPPLRAADPAHLPDLEPLTQYEAVRLFIERAVAVQPTFVVTNQNAPAVASICHRLDGIPLAIELAAARSRVLTPEQIAARLGNRFNLLTGGSRNALPRQRTLRALVDWSHDLLSDDEKTLLRRLSVFTGGWSLEAAEAVCGDRPIDSSDVLELLSRLVDKSLVVAEEHIDGRMRYRMLETLREYATEQLRLAGEHDVYHERHRNWCLAFAEWAEPELWRADQGAWYLRLESEHDNMRAAIEWSAARAAGDQNRVPSVTPSRATDDEHIDPAQAGLRLGAALGRFWFERGYFAEGRARLAAVLALADEPTPARSRALSAASVLAFVQGDFEALTALSSEAVDVSRACPEDRHGQAFALLMAAIEADLRGDTLAGAPMVEQCLAIWQELDNPVGHAYAVYTLGEIEWVRGNQDRAVGLIQQSVAATREAGDLFASAVFGARLAHVKLLNGDVGGSLGIEREILNARWRLDDRFGIAESLTGIACALAELGDHQESVVLLSAADDLWAETGGVLIQRYREGRERTMTTAHSQLGPERFAHAWNTGKELRLDEVVALASSGRTPASRPRPAVSET